MSRGEVSHRGSSVAEEFQWSQPSDSDPARSNPVRPGYYNTQGRPGMSQGGASSVRPGNYRDWNSVEGRYVQTARDRGIIEDIEDSDTDDRIDKIISKRQ